jgi:hypothetical protein
MYPFRNVGNNAVDGGLYPRSTIREDHRWWSFALDDRLG